MLVLLVFSYQFNWAFNPLSILEFIIIEMEKVQAAGSIWNVNSWHWEMKNYVEPAKKILEQKLMALVFEASPELHIKHKKVRFPKAECEINVRKGKQILVYDF